MRRRQFLKSSLLAGVSYTALRAPVGVAAEPDALGYRRTLDRPARYFDGEHFWVHARAGIVPAAGRDGQPRVVMTMNTMETVGSDVFRAVVGTETDDLGGTWSDVQEIAALAPREETIEGQLRPVAVSDYWPRWHVASRMLLGTGHDVAYAPDWTVGETRPRSPVYSAYDAAERAWRPWRRVEMPSADGKYFDSGAGCTQRFDLSDGSILLPFYFRPPKENSRVAVMRATFDGTTLSYVEHGDELSIEGTRGLHEPSLTRFGDMFYLTLRNDKQGYVTRGGDGLHFEPYRPWTFDDGAELGNYNTQQHWVTHSDGLFLVYTRRGANNDHVFRHRAPLFMAQVDPERLCVIRDTEHILVPERGARLGNFGVTDVSPSETWVTVTEWMQPCGCEKYGSDGSVFVARLHWQKPNEAFRA